MSSNAFKKLSPEVRRELLRHVKPSSSSQKGKLAAKRLEESERSRNASTKLWLVGCVGFVGCAATLPYYATQKIGSLTDRDDPLTAAQNRRGAFMNSGSRDAGKDTNWDLKNGRYVYPKGFAEHLKMQNPEETDFGPDIGPMVQNERKQQKLKQQKQQQS
eukprot:CAMPEP_0116129282 /NCGR_PEP_ID=MMETSP0329-20121206/7843_1 /TAXON_ID=697910 /ORGANISM="Pseudo-nitzschia arenysensis, Strain B593" /LENGTH=159 /DNA_ID=CAMNT_0003623543 /DNA_START=42 /DNA_END=521 /DNA_ORIENTATION=-